jgi:hypothetical protein
MERNRKDKFAAAIDVVIFGGWCSEYDKVSGVLRRCVRFVPNICKLDLGVRMESYCHSHHGRLIYITISIFI